TLFRSRSDASVSRRSCGIACKSATRRGSVIGEGGGRGSASVPAAARGVQRHGARARARSARFPCSCVAPTPHSRRASAPACGRLHRVGFRRNGIRRAVFCRTAPGVPRSTAKSHDAVRKRRSASGIMQGFPAAGCKRMTLKTSFPKQDIRVVLFEGISQSAVDVFRAAGYEQVELLPKSLAGDELKAKLANAHIVGIRSRTQLTEDVLAEARKLLTIGCFCIGT